MRISNRARWVWIVLLTLSALLITPGCTKKAQAERHLKRADGYFQAGEYDKARIEYLNLLRIDPQNVVGVERLGTIWSEQGAPLQALPFLLRVQEIAPDNLESRKKLASALFSIAQIPEARKTALTILDAAPADKDAILLLANSSFTEDQAEETRARLEKFDPETSVAYHLATAMLAGRKGEVETVGASLQRAEKIDPDSVDVQLALATYSRIEGETANARTALKKAAGLSNPRSAARLNYAGFLAQAGEREEAKKVLAEVTTKAPDYLPGWTLYAELLSSEGKQDEALAILQKVFGQDPQNLEARSLEAGVTLAKGDSPKALALLKQLDSSFLNVPVIKYNLARAYLAEGDLARSRARLIEALTINPDYGDALFLLAQVHLRKGAAVSAAAALEDFLRRKGLDFAPAQLLLARAYQMQGRLDEAATIFRGQIDKKPDQAAPRFMLGMIQRQQGKVDEARQSMEKAQELAPNDDAITFQLVELDILKKDFESAHRKVRRHLDKKSDSWSALYLEGRVYAAEAKWQEAEEVLLKALDTKPNSVTVYNLLVDCYLSEGKADAAIERLKTVAGTNPKSLQHHMLLGLLYDQQKNEEEAAKAYEQVLAANPNFVPALNNLAYLQAKQTKDLGRAFELAGKARSLAPDDPAIADTLGWIHYRKGEYPQALALLDEAAGKTPESPEIALHLGLARYMMGQKEGARMALEKAAGAKADFPGKEEARQRLVSLSSIPEDLSSQSVEELEALVQQQPKDPLLRERLGRLYESQGAIAKAVAAYEEALKINGSLLDPLRGLVRLQAGPLRNADKAREYARKARAIAPSDPEILGLLGGLALRQSDAAQAYALLQEAVPEPGNEVGLRSQLAWAAYGLGKVEEATETMRRIQQSAPASPEAREAATFILLAMPGAGDWEAVEPAAEKKLKEDPAFLPALMVRATLLEARGKSQEAAAAYAAVLKRMPEFGPAQKRLATLYGQDPSRLDQAHELAMKARKTLPADPEVARTLGVLSYQKGEASYAVQLLEESAATVPLDSEGLFYLGSAYLKSKQAAKGEAVLQNALDAGLAPPHADEARAALSKAGKP